MLSRLVCRLRGHDWEVYTSRPHWTIPVKEVYLLEAGDSVVLEGWDLTERCCRCPTLRRRRFTGQGATEPGVWVQSHISGIDPDWSERPRWR